MADETGLGIEESIDSDSPIDYAGLTQTVRDLIEVMRQGEIERLEVSQGDLHILLCARSSNSHSSPATAPAGESAPATQPTSAPTEPDQDKANFHQITSPMVGTFYEAPSPGESPFVRPGDTVTAGQTVAIIEAMKIMNEIVADRPGVVDEVLVENGEAVEFGHPLFRLRPV